MNWKNQIEANFGEIKKYNILGIRGTQDDENYKIGDCARNSKDWDFENDRSSDNDLLGTCAVSIDIYTESADDLVAMIEDKIGDVSVYNCKQIVLLGGYDGDYGDDKSEIVIKNAKVLAIIDQP